MVEWLQTWYNKTIEISPLFLGPQPSVNPLTGKYCEATIYRNRKALLTPKSELLKIAVSDGRQRILTKLVEEHLSNHPSCSLQADAASALRLSKREALWDEYAIKLLERRDRLMQNPSDYRRYGYEQGADGSVQHASQTTLGHTE